MIGVSFIGSVLIRSLPYNLMHLYTEQDVKTEITRVLSCIISTSKTPGRALDERARVMWAKHSNSHVSNWGINLNDLHELMDVFL